MQERKLPWWRRALNVALDGIRSGFGLFSKPPKEEPVHEPEAVSGPEEAPGNETLLTGHSAAIESAGVTAVAEESIHLSEAIPEVVAGPFVEEPLQVPEAVFEPVAEAAAAQAAEAVAEPVAELNEEPVKESLPEGDAVEAGSGKSVPDLEATSQEQTPDIEAEEESSGIAEPAPEAQLEPESTIETVAVDEASLEEIPVEISAAEPEEEISGPPELPGETAPDPEVYTAPEPEGAAEKVSEIPSVAVGGTEVESEAPVEAVHQVASLNDSTHEDASGTADAPPEHDAAEAAPDSEISHVPESVSAPAAEDDPVPIEDSIPEEAVSSVELSEPIPAEVAAETDGQPGTVGDESQEEGPSASEADPQSELPTGRAAEHEPEQVAEEEPEPADIPMELNEPIPEQPTEANESLPIEEAVPAAAQAPADETTAQLTAAEAMAAEATAALADEAGPTAAVTPTPPSKPFIKLESRDNESDLSPFSVVVSQVYDGPLDLLLDLIRKQDIDIYDIPIARITAQFLAYVNQLKATDVDVAGEFIYTASLLIHIKSKMLLPRAPSGGDDAAEDPRRELVERLLEHERFKNAAQMLQQKQMLEAATWTNPGLREFQDDTSAEPEIAADTVDLVRIFRDILERARNRPVINVEEDSVTVGQMIQFLARRLTMEDKPVALRRLLSQTRSERALIAMFLALLELVRLQAILLRQDKLFSEIFIKKHVGFETVMNEGAASVHDDWR